MKNKYFVGQNIMYRESGGYGIADWYDLYAKKTYFDKIKSIDESGEILTENGVKLKISKGNMNYGELVFKGKLKDTFVDDMFGKEMPHNLGAFYSNKPIFKLYIEAFKDEKSYLEFRQSRIDLHAKHLKERKDKKAYYKNQKQLRDKALEPLTKLIESNDKIRRDLKRAEHDLEQLLIKKHCKEFEVIFEGTEYERLECKVW